MARTLSVLFRTMVIFLITIHTPLPSFAGKAFKSDDGYFLKYLRQEKFAIDTSAPAIVLYEYHSYDIREAYKKHQVRRIIKILKQSGSRYADISIPLPGYIFGYFHVNKIHGTTYNLDGDKLIRQEISPENLAIDNSGMIKEKKINMPAVKEGSIIDYTYEIETQGIGIELADWRVQENIPKLYAMMELFTPKAYNYVAEDHARTFVSFEDTKAGVSDEDVPTAFTNSEVIGENILRETWVRRNISAFGEEPYLGCEANYRENLAVYLQSVHAIVNHGILNTWPKINEYLVTSLSFGRTVSAAGSSVNDKAMEIAGKSTDQLTIAKNIYKFVRDSIKSTGANSLYAYKSLEKVLRERSGSSTEINLLLTAMNQNAGLSCSPMILATRDIPTPIYLNPALSKYNYTVCDLVIKGDKYYLDASEKYNPFGRLPEYCLNGYARVIDRHDSCGILLGADMVTERSLYAVTTTDNSTNNYTLNCKFYFSASEALDKRKAWCMDTAAIRKYVNDFFKESTLPVTIKNYKVQNLYDPENQLTLEFDIKIDWPAQGTVYLAPYFVKFFETNPFTNAWRRYPMSFPAKENKTYTINLKLPAGYTIEEIPKPSIVNLNDHDQYKNMVTYDKEANMLTIYSRLQLGDTWYPVSQYSSVKDFFDKMGEAQQASLAIKK
jgi:hypothetical protein